MNFNNPFADEFVPLTEEELELVVAPMLRFIDQDKFCLAESCCDSIILRTVRGTMNKTPTTEKWKSLVSSCQVSVHCGASGEIIEQIHLWRTREDIQANNLLSRTLVGAEDFHRLWPVSITGYDDIGHPIICERLRDIQTDVLTAQFSLSEILVFRAQVHEMIQLCTTREGKRRHQDLSKHSHVGQMITVDIHAERVHDNFSRAGYRCFRGDHVAI
jgi:hypothetical protein